MTNPRDEIWKKASGRGKPGPEPTIPNGLPHTDNHDSSTTHLQKNVYLVGQIRHESKWEFQGVFSTKELADYACKHPNYFYTEVTLNQELPHETTDMDNICFPRCTQPYYVICPMHGVLCTTYDRENVDTRCSICGSELSFDIICS